MQTTSTRGATTRTTRGRIGLVIAALCTALVAGRAEAATMVTFEIDVEIIEVGLDDGMGGTLGDFGFEEGDFFSNVGLITLTGPDPDATGYAEFDQVTEFYVSLDGPDLSWELGDILDPMTSLGYVYDGEVLALVPSAQNAAGTDLENAGRKKAARKKARRKKAATKKATSAQESMAISNIVNIFDDQNAVVAEFTLWEPGARVIPEPGAMALFGTGALLLTWRLRRRRQPLG